MKGSFQLFAIHLYNLIFCAFIKCLDNVARFLPLLDMLQDIHFKLMNRIREHRETMQASEFQICPRIKAKLDLAFTQSRDRRASWDGLRTFVVCILLFSVSI